MGGGKKFKEEMAEQTFFFFSFFFFFSSSFLLFLFFLRFFFFFSFSFFLILLLQADGVVEAWVNCTDDVAAVQPGALQTTVGVAQVRVLLLDVAVTARAGTLNRSWCVWSARVQAQRLWSAASAEVVTCTVDLTAFVRAATFAGDGDGGGGGLWSSAWATVLLAAGGGLAGLCTVVVTVGLAVHCRRRLKQRGQRKDTMVVHRDVPPAPPAVVLTPSGNYIESVAGMSVIREPAAHAPPFRSCLDEFGSNPPAPRPHPLRLPRPRAEHTYEDPDQLRADRPAADYLQPRALLPADTGYLSLRAAKTTQQLPNDTDYIVPQAQDPAGHNSTYVTITN